MKKIHLLLLIKSQYVSLQLRAANCIYFSQNKLYYVKLLERTIVIVGKSAQISCTSYTSSLRVSQIEIAGCGLGTQCTLSSGGTGSSVLAGFLEVPVLWQCPQHSQPSRVSCSPLPCPAGNCHSLQWRCPETAQEQSQPGLHRPIPSTPPAAQSIPERGCAHQIQSPPCTGSSPVGDSGPCLWVLLSRGTAGNGANPSWSGCLDSEHKHKPAPHGFPGGSSPQAGSSSRPANLFSALDALKLPTLIITTAAQAFLYFMNIAHQ